MKTQNHLFFLIGLLSIIVFPTSSVEAQTSDQRINITTNAGFSGVGILARSINLVSTTAYPGLESGTSVAYQVAADYAINDRFSVGAAFSTQNSFMNGISTDSLGFNIDVDLSFRRTNFALRGLVHYGFDKPKLDMYSGIRVGFTNTNFDFTDRGESKVITDLVEPLIDIVSDQPSFQVILFGMRYYFTKNIGLNFESTLGSPHYFSGGLSFRF